MKLTCHPPVYFDRTLCVSRHLTFECLEHFDGRSAQIPSQMVCVASFSSWICRSLTLGRPSLHVSSCSPWSSLSDSVLRSTPTLVRSSIHLAVAPTSRWNPAWHSPRWIRRVRGGGEEEDSQFGRITLGLVRVITNLEIEIEIRGWRRPHLSPEPCRRRSH